jgi:hypothetical protein
VCRHRVSGSWSRSAPASDARIPGKARDRHSYGKPQLRLDHVLPPRRCTPRPAHRVPAVLSCLWPASKCCRLIGVRLNLLLRCAPRPGPPGFALLAHFWLVCPRAAAALVYGSYPCVAARHGRGRPVPGFLACFWPVGPSAAASLVYGIYPHAAAAAAGPTGLSLVQFWADAPQPR